MRWDLFTFGNWVGSGHPCTGLRSGHLRFLGFSGVARKLVKVSEIVEMPWEIAQEASESCSGSLGKSHEVLGSLRKGMELSELSQQCFESVMGHNTGWRTEGARRVASCYTSGKTSQDHNPIIVTLGDVGLGPTAWVRVDYGSTSWHTPRRG